jgi:hypothetical protein
MMILLCVGGGFEKILALSRSALGQVKVSDTST